MFSSFLLSEELIPDYILAHIEKDFIHRTFRCRSCNYASRKKHNMARHVDRIHIKGQEPYYAEPMISHTFQPPKRGRKRKSGIWEHFDDSDYEKGLVVCRHCGESLKSSGGSTGSLWTHVKRKHNISKD